MESGGGSRLRIDIAMIGAPEYVLIKSRVTEAV
jgi:hypothetical protein